MTLNNTQKLLAGTIALVLVIGMTAPAFADITGTGDDVTPSEISPTAIVPIVDCAVDTGIIVAFETSNGQSSDPHSIWIGDLQADGFTVREMDID